LSPPSDFEKLNFLFRAQHYPNISTVAESHRMTSKQIIINYLFGEKHCQQYTADFHEKKETPN